MQLASGESQGNVLAKGSKGPILCVSLMGIWGYLGCSSADALMHHDRQISK